jgi:hypothetical protein
MRRIAVHFNQEEHLEGQEQGVKSLEGDALPLQAQQETVSEELSQKESCGDSRLHSQTKLQSFALFKEEEGTEE